MPEALLEMRGISKSFGGNRVLREVDLSLWPREVHAVVGENGAGKSTLMKILSGVYAKDGGSIRLEGRDIHIANPHDGRRVFSGEFASVDASAIIRHMVGREIQELFPRRDPPGMETVLEVRGLSDPKRYRNISFQLHRGEILGVAGLVGAGRSALARGIFGLEPPLEGSVWLHGKPFRPESAGHAIGAGLAYLTEDRKMTSLFPHLSLAHNISMAALDKVKIGPVLRLSEEATRCRALIEKLQIRARSESDPIYRLSGGNQQKSLIARWLFAGSSVLLLDEPTQGVDLAARAEIYRLMKETVSKGGAILMISSGLPELLGMSHRIMVMRRGELVAALRAEETTREEIMAHAALVQ